MSYPAFSTQSLPVVLASDEAAPWNITLHITGAVGIGNTVVFGEKPDASNGQDQYDLPEPPAPPQLPYILAWFSTPFPAPFDKLLQEYKQYPAQHAVWNLSILWISGNNSPTTLTITWDSSRIVAQNHFSLLLYENGTRVASMLINHSYSFSLSGNLHRFQIISENESSESPSENTFPIFSVSIGIILIVCILILLSLVYRKKKK